MLRVGDVVGVAWTRSEAKIQIFHNNVVAIERALSVSEQEQLTGSLLGVGAKDLLPAKMFPLVDVSGHVKSVRLRPRSVRRTDASRSDSISGTTASPVKNGGSSRAYSPKPRTVDSPSSSD